MGCYRHRDRDHRRSFDGSVPDASGSEFGLQHRVFPLFSTAARRAGDQRPGHSIPGTGCKRVRHRKGDRGRSSKRGQDQRRHCTGQAPDHHHHDRDGRICGAGRTVRPDRRIAVLFYGRSLQTRRQRPEKNRHLRPQRRIRGSPRGSLLRGHISASRSFMWEACCTRSFSRPSLPELPVIRLLRCLGSATNFTLWILHQPCQRRLH